MKITLGNTWARVSEQTPEELQLLQNRLTFAERQQDAVVVTEFLRKNKQPHFLSGLLPLLDGLDYTLVDKRTKVNINVPEIGTDLLEGITLRQYQSHAIRKCLMWKRGILWVPTRGGKTEIFAGLTKILTHSDEFKGNVLIVTPDRMLMHQTYDRLVLRGVDDIGKIGDKLKQTNNRVSVGIIDTLYNMARDERYNDFFKSINCIVIDEVHHLSSDSYQFLAERCSHTEYTIGVSGTPFKGGESNLSNSSDAVLIGYFHQVIMQVTTQFLIDNGYIAEPNVFYLSYTMETKPAFFIKDYHKVYNRFIVKNKERNSLAAKIAVRLSNLDFSTLISVVRLEHGFILLDLIAEHLPETIFVSAKFGILSKYTKELYKELEQDFSVSTFTHDDNKYIQYPEDFPYESWFSEKRYKVLIGSSVFDEGRDLPTLDGIILMGAGGKSEVKNIQRPARALTKSASTSRVYIIDFDDLHHPYLKNHSELRRQSYERHAYNIHQGMDSLGTFITSLVNSRQETLELENDE